MFAVLIHWRKKEHWNVHYENVGSIYVYFFCIKQMRIGITKIFFQEGKVDLHYSLLLLTNTAPYFHHSAHFEMPWKMDASKHLFSWQTFEHWHCKIKLVPPTLHLMFTVPHSPVSLFSWHHCSQDNQKYFIKFCMCMLYGSVRFVKYLHGIITLSLG